MAAHLRNDKCCVCSDAVIEEVRSHLVDCNLAGLKKRRCILMGENYPISSKLVPITFPLSLEIDALKR